ncbi:MAG TPA: DUF5916 domain-containing protein [Saprospiraceae bacterium]|nr:DUF5916 domain-containing protein [Saprospiraceae bacterium]
MTRSNCLIPVLLLLPFCALKALPMTVPGGGNPSSDEIVQKEMVAMRIDESIKVDGKLDEAAWQKVAPAGEFVQYQPVPGGAPSFPTEVKILYDDVAIYIGAKMLDPVPDSIYQELSERDHVGNSDWFNVIIDTYRSGLNGYAFGLTPAGIQYDALIEDNGRRDRNWDAVWESQAVITEEGWIAEIRIPYSALRFPSQKEQNWHINFMREIRRVREQSYWNPINPAFDQFLAQSGVLEGIVDIKPPMRLSAYPFVAAYAENYHDKTATPSSSWGKNISGGMDVKMGISEAFTLDMTLIPDFSQVQSDNQVLNLSPFEVRFDENRQFFIEGTELFNKMNLFYSRRIGGTPLHYGDVEGNLKDGEVIISNPLETPLINATKVSGRTTKGTGIGVFNAVVGGTDARIQTAEGHEVAVQTNPLTNYSILTVDQQLPYNSFINLTNTNVWRNGQDYEANVTGTAFQFNTRKRTYGIGGRAIVNQKYFTDSTNLGYSYSINAEKISGQWQWGAGYNEEAPNYDINDMGYIHSPNEKSWSARVSYSEFEPFWAFNRADVRVSTNYRRLNEPDEFTDFGVYLRAFARTKNFWGTGLNINWEPVETFDYFEPRTDDYSLAYRYPRNVYLSSFLSTNYNKRLAFDLNGGWRWFEESGRQFSHLGIGPRFRINNQWSIYWNTTASVAQNDIGYVDATEAAGTIFGRRDRTTVENLFRSNFAFSNTTTLSFRLRHYWSKVAYDRFSKLLSDGHLAAADYSASQDANYNAFTIDMVYRWRFAPGSDIFLVWKQSVYESGDVPEVNYWRNLQDLYTNPLSNSFSMKCIYFLDYQNLVHKS